jgi:hypothetical protein
MLQTSRTGQILAFPRSAPARLPQAAPVSARVPYVELRLTDPRVRAWRLSDNTFRLEGVSSEDLAGFAELTVDGGVVRCPLGQGEGAVVSCQRIAAALPPGYRATLHPELPLGSCALSIHRDDESGRTTAAA